MLTYVHYLWILLSLLIAITCTYCLLQPEWFVHPDSVHAFGVYAFCVKDSRMHRTFRHCDFYGGRFGFGNIPSTPWQAACLLYGGGCLFMCIASVCSLGTMCVKNGCDKTLVLLTRYLQTAAVFLMFSGLVVYPVGLGSQYFRFYCGDSASDFRSGDCQMGWTYMLAIAGNALSIFCPIFSYLSEVESGNFIANYSSTEKV